jgi:hypothetical protein
MVRGLGAVLVVIAMFVAAACGGVLKKEYEYEEELYPALDGSATLYINASIPALVALRGADLDINPRARFDKRKVRALFSAPAFTVATPTSSRRNGRRFVHVRIDVDDMRQLSTNALLAWSAYRVNRNEDVIELRQSVGAPAGKPVGDVGWTGDELVAFRMHLPSRIQFHNSNGPVQRGNILAWEQPLKDRLRGAPMVAEVRMDPTSILSRTLLLFGSTIVAALVTFAAVIWWLARGKEEALVVNRES